MKLEGRDTAGRFALWEGILPDGAAPPLHSHPEDETLYILDGELTAWLVEPELADDGSEPPAWVESRGRRCGVGDVVFAPGGTPHSFRVGPPPPSGDNQQY
jgi:quercetin dioxygenase-like cupin family protein